jgi:phenylalanyl-tRNA synthetase beta chain
MQHGIFTDAVTRFSKGQSPLQNVAVITKAADEIMQIAGGTHGSAVDSVHISKEALERGSVHAPIVTSTTFINRRLGSALKTSEIATLLGNVEFAVEEHGDELVITAPFWRTDIEIPEDVVEEVGRLHGFEHLSHQLPIRDTHAVETPSLDILKNRIRDILSSVGANELQTYSFVPARLLQQVGQEKVHAFAIRNALSPELEHYRLSLTPNLLDKVHANIKAGFKEFALFEMNKIHIKGDDFVDCDGLPREYQTVAFVFASDSGLPGAAYYYAKRYLDYLLDELGVARTIAPIEHPPVFEIGRQVMAPFEQKRTGYVYVGEGEFGGFVGEYRAAVAKNLKLPRTIAGFEIDIERLLKTQHTRRYRPLLKFPATEQDVCLKVENAVMYSQLEAAVRASFAADERLRLTVAPLDIYQRRQEPDYKQITFRITLQHHDRTLTTQEVNDMLDAMVQKVATAVGGAERI